jgi:hypothetical protein
LANHQAHAATLLSRLSRAELDVLTNALAPLERLADSAVRSALSAPAMHSGPTTRASGR